MANIDIRFKKFKKFAFKSESYKYPTFWIRIRHILHWGAARLRQLAKGGAFR
jgi:hypothetical protein